MTSTLTNVRGEDAEPRSTLGRRIGMGVLLCVVVAGTAGVLGDRDGTATASEDGYTVELTYPQSARAGLDRPWELRVTNPAGFDDEITVVVSADYFSMFEHQGMDPQPSASTRDGEDLWWTFDAPDGDTFVVSVDQYVQPNVQSGRSGVVAVVVDGRRVAPVDFRTVIFP